MIRANDKGLASPPQVVEEPARAGIVSGRNLIILVGIIAWLAVLVLFIVPNIIKKPDATIAPPATAGTVANTTTGAVAKPAAGVDTGAVAAAGPKAVPLPELDLTNRVINLAGNAAGYKYVKLSLAVQFADPTGQFAKAGGANLPKLQTTFAADNAGAVLAFNDILTTVVGSKTAADLSTPQGKEALRQELISKFNAATAGTNNRVAYILFTDFVMQ